MGQVENDVGKESIASKFTSSTIRLQASTTELSKVVLGSRVRGLTQVLHEHLRASEEILRAGPIPDRALLHELIRPSPINSTTGVINNTSINTNTSALSGELNSNDNIRYTLIRRDDKSRGTSSKGGKSLLETSVLHCRDDLFLQGLGTIVVNVLVFTKTHLSL
jgi:hypothetical protein